MRRRGTVLAPRVVPEAEPLEVMRSFAVELLLENREKDRLLRLAGEADADNDQAAGLSKEAKALAALVDHPDWTDTKIAEAAGCARTELYRMPKYKAAKAAMKSGRQDAPSGVKDAQTGDVEAWGEPD